MVEIRIDLSEEEAKNLGHTAAGNPVTKENACIGVRFESDLTYSKDESNFVEYPHGFADRILAEMAAAESGWSVWCNSWLEAKFLATYYEALPKEFSWKQGSPVSYTSFTTRKWNRTWFGQVIQTRSGIVRKCPMLMYGRTEHAQFESRRKKTQHTSWVCCRQQEIVHKNNLTRAEVSPRTVKRID